MTSADSTPAQEHGRDEELAAARQRIAALEEELDAARSAPEDAQVAAGLRAALTRTGAAGVLTAPAQHASLESTILQTAMEVLGATAATLYELDDTTQELVFAVSLGPNAAPLQGARLPPGTGIAGWVAMSGQPLAIANLDQDPRWSRDVGHRSGYTPRAMVAVPLVGPDRVVGVMQLMDKGTGEPFSAADMTTVTLFAQQAAIAIAQSQALHSLAALLRLALAGADAPPDLVAQAQETISRAESTDSYRASLEMARLVGDIAASSDAGRRLATDVLGAIQRYTTVRRGR